jgi:hypothetical protein
VFDATSITVVEHWTGGVSPRCKSRKTFVHEDVNLVIVYLSLPVNDTHMILAVKISALQSRLLQMRKHVPQPLSILLLDWCHDP